MKFSIEIEEFYISEDNDLESELANSIITEVVRRIKESIKEQIDKQIDKAVSDMSAEFITPTIQGVVSDCIETGAMTSSGKAIMIKDYIKNLFENNSGWSNPEEKIKRLAKEYGESIQKRVDMQFATQIVAKLHEQKMLHPDVAAALFSGDAGK